jgi:hypothetical protein
MTEEPKKFRLDAEPGHYTLGGGDANLRVKIGTANAFANTAMLVGDAFSSPFTRTAIVPPSVTSGAEAAADAAAKIGGPGFKLALIAAVAITLICLLLIVVLPFLEPDPPTKMQAEAFDTIRAVFCAGAGAFIGLFTGKAA